MKKVWIVWLKDEDDDLAYSIFSSKRKAKNALKHVNCVAPITKVLVDNYKPKKEEG